MATVTIEKEISWGYDVCILRNFRVEGQVDTSLIEEVWPTTEYPVVYVINVTACSVEEVCRKLSKNRYLNSVKKIHLYADPVFSSEAEGEPSEIYFVDVTPSVSNCADCCDFLVEEDKVMEAKFTTGAMYYYSFTSSSGTMQISQPPVQSHFQHNISGTMELSSEFTESVIYTVTSTGSMAISNLTTNISSYYEYEFSGTMQVTSQTQVASSHYNFTSDGTMRVINYTTLNYGHSLTGQMILSGGMSPQLILSHQMTGQMDLSGSFVVDASSHYTHEFSGQMFLSTTTESQSSNVGVLDMFSGTEATVTEVGVRFSTTAVDLFIPTATSVILDNCCSVPIPTILNLRHNLRSLHKLSQFLIRNGKILAGDLSASSDPLLLQYRPRLGIWSANVHFRGLSAQGEANETWSLTFDLSCTSLIGGSLQGDNKWKFSFTLKKVTGSYDSLSRLMVVLPQEIVCASEEAFDGFTVLYNLKNKSVNPSGAKAVFYDESSVFNSSLSLFNRNSLEFRIFVEEKQLSQFLDHSLEKQRKATVDVAEN